MTNPTTAELDQEEKLSIDGQWFYRGNRSTTWLACISLPGGLMGGACEKVPPEVWPILESVAKLERQRDELAEALRQFAECSLTEENCASMELATIRIRSIALRALTKLKP